MAISALLPFHAELAVSWAKRGTSCDPLAMDDYRIFIWEYVPCRSLHPIRITIYIYHVYIYILCVYIHICIYKCIFIVCTYVIFCVYIYYVCIGKYYVYIYTERELFILLSWKPALSISFIHRFWDALPFHGSRKLHCMRIWRPAPAHRLRPQSVSGPRNPQFIKFRPQKKRWMSQETRKREKRS